jgi:excisionase family DNA binding protein
LVTLDDFRGRAVASPDELASLLGCSSRSVHRMLDRGELPELRLGRRRYVPVPALLRLLGAEADVRQEEPV